MRHGQGRNGNELVEEPWDQRCAYANSQFCTRGEATRASAAQWFINWCTNAEASDKVILFDSEHQGYFSSTDGCMAELRWAKTSPNSPGYLRVGRYIDEGWSAEMIAEEIIRRLG